MTLETQFKIKNNKYYLQYLRENSYWYKLLNRNPSLFSKFEEEVKIAYGLRPADKLNRALSTIEMLQTIMSTLK